ncbi:hypothetical protein ACFFV7_21425 [Nonomuraea spiralis]|uniref:Uncharacterized protein n=1 Tax=Nonomuraea spiralis TaxID=46182 RepID=A0ABV5IGU3_9ACTN|nr:hypothetical protein [Nonomuraea spiralis]
MKVILPRPDHVRDTDSVESGATAGRAGRRAGHRQVRALRPDLEAPEPPAVGGRQNHRRHARPYGPQYGREQRAAHPASLRWSWPLTFGIPSRRSRGIWRRWTARPPARQVPQGQGGDLYACAPPTGSPGRPW